MYWLYMMITKAIYGSVQGEDYIYSMKMQVHLNGLNMTVLIPVVLQMML